MNISTLKRFLFLLLPVFFALPSHSQWNYPPTKTVDAADIYFGKTYPDPYRWLENLKDKEVEAWFKAQAKLTDELLAKIPGRDALAQKWMELDKLLPPLNGKTFYENGRIFYKKRLGEENVGKLFFREGWNGADKELFDPAKYKAGVTTTIDNVLPSWDGKFVVLGLSSGGAEWSEIRVLDVERGLLLPESIYPSGGPYGWTPDGRSFFYDAGNVTDLKSVDIDLNRQTRLHKLGTAINTDIDFFSNETNPELGITAKEIPRAYIDEFYPSYVIGSVETVQNEKRVFYAPSSEMESGNIKWKTLCQPSDNLVGGIKFHGDYVYAVTHAGAPRYKVVRTHVSHPDWEHAETIIPECADSIQYIVKTKHFLLIVYSNGIVGRLVKHDLTTGKTEEVKLPASGTVFSWPMDWKSDFCGVAISSWTVQHTLYDYYVEKGTFTKSIFIANFSYPGFDYLVSEEVEVPRHDGTMVPLSIVYAKGIPLNGSNSCILDGYGAYGSSAISAFSTQVSVAKQGVVLAFAHPRGGGEKGEAWHKAGFKTTKPNTWKDFISCAEYLVKKGYTSPQKLGAIGTSAGGILISRAITERPDLFGAAVCNVGLANAMRMEFAANGPANIPEFGTVTDPAECQALFEMDGVQHVQKGVKYPAVMGVGGWNDSRVTPWETGKFIAALQHANGSENPILMKVNYDNGHFTEEKTVTFKDLASQFAFLLWRTGHKEFQPVQ